MRSLRRSLPIIVLFLALEVSICESSWMLDGQLWSSPYHQGEVYLSQLSVTLEPGKHLQATASLPIQFTRTSHQQELEYLYPRLTIAWSPPLGDVFSGNLRAHYHLKPHRIELQGGLHMLLDPIVLRYGLSYHDQALALEGSVIFAVNERWALGAHLQYTRNSVLTYEVHHTTKGGKHRQISYSHYLDGSLQCLGLKIAL